MIELLSTKLFIPRPRKNLVLRPHLVQRLNAGLEKKLTLIAAPAGFGKTTLVSEWIPQSPRCVTWLSLDADDNDSTRFWTYFIASIRQLRSDLGESALALLQSWQIPPITSILTALINDIGAFPDAFAIVLDDYHVIESQPIHDALTFLIAHLPVRMHLVMTTRIDPPLPLARLRARDETTEIRANGLRFNAKETQSFLTREVGERLTAEEIAVLEQRTEGWIAGLQIAALSMQGRDDISGFIRAFSGSHRHILGYLADEALNQRPKGTLNFLLQTSILKRLCEPLCNAVTGQPGGQETLESLERANLFITALDDEGRWYRYHHLFAEVLQARLIQTNPKLVSILHRRAGEWYLSQGMLDEAILHYLAGGEIEAASNLIESVAGLLLRKGSSATLSRWLDALSEGAIRSRPRLCLARAWTIFMGLALDLAMAEQWSQLAIQKAQTDGTLDSDLMGEVAALRAMIAITRGDIALSRELSQQALDYLPADSPWLKAVTFSLGTTHLDFGDLTAAARNLEEALRLSQTEGDYFIQLASASFLADIQMTEGNLDNAMQIYRQVLAWSDPNLPQKGTVMAYGGLASILYERNQLDEALEYTRVGIAQLERVGGEYAAFTVNRAMARIHQTRGNWSQALDILERAYQRGQNAQVSMVARQASALRAGLQLAQGDLGAATVWAQDSGLDTHDAGVDHPGWRETEYLTLARVLAAQGRYSESRFLLDRLLHSAQVDGRDGSAIGILALQAVVDQAQGDRRRALESLERALSIAEPEGFIRVFVDEGEPMHLLLIDCQATLKVKLSEGISNESMGMLKYTDKLLDSFSQSRSVKDPDHETLTEPLSERELDVLQLIATGRSNKEIAEILVIAVSTVKSHIKNMNGKLGTNSRTQAIAAARHLGLLSD